MRWQLILGVLAAVASAAARDAHADVVVLDTCVAQCDEEDRRLIGMFRRMAASRFQRPGLAIAPSDVLAAIGGGIPSPAVTNPGMTSRAIIEELKLGIEHWINGRYEQAASQLGEGLGTARLHPVLVASDAILRQLIPRAHVGQAVSLWRLGRRAAAKDAIAELVRTLPEPSILDSWGTEADKIFQLAREELDALGKGALVVDVDDPSTIFYLNEAGQPHRSMFAAMLRPGPYRVLVQDARGRSRRFHATVRPDDTSMLRIRWQRELRFSSSGDHIGFVFESAAARVNEGDHARHFASLAKSDLVVVIGRIRWREGAAMIGTIYSASSDAAYRVGVVPITGDEPSALRELATFLFSPGEPAPSVIALDAPPWEAPAPGVTSPWLGIQYPLGWALSGGAVAAGATWIATGSDGERRGYARYMLVGAGLIGGLVTTVLYLRRGNTSAPAVATAMVDPTRAGLIAGIGWRF